MKFATVLVCVFLVGICRANFIASSFEDCLQERYSVGTEDTKKKTHTKPDPDLEWLSPDIGIYYLCGCEPTTDKYCIALGICVKDSTPDDLLVKYKDCGVYATVEPTHDAEKKEPKDGHIGGRCEQWRYCNGEARCENYKCVPHACKKEGEIPSGPDDKCCMPMVTRKGKPCKLLNTDHNSGTCNSHRQCQLDHEGRDYVCCYKFGHENAPKCVLNNQCPWGDLYSQ